MKACWKILSIAGLAGALLLLVGCASTGVNVPSEWDGLKRVPSRNVDQLFVLPGTQLGPFQAVILEDTKVSFDRNWNPNRSQRGLSRQLSQNDMDRIRREVGEMMDAALRQELERGGYRVVTTAEADTLHIAPAIINLYITAPDTRSAGRSTIWVMDAGRMTLFMEFRDAYSHRLIARAVDTRGGTSFGQMQVANSATNSAEARRATTAWARTLVRGLDGLKEATP